jgi:5-oxoprolinase (ATP-hydrolysing) subunit B
MVTLAEPAMRSAVAATLARAMSEAGIRNGMQTVLVELREPDPALLGRVREALSAPRPEGAAVASSSRTVRIGVEYGGLDLDEVARTVGCSVSDVIAAHAMQTWTVAMIGFAPGFAYLLPWDAPRLDWTAVPRRDRPRERVAGGSVAVAAGMSAVYPSTMPGGWHLIGRTSLRVFDASDAGSPSLLLPGDFVRFDVEDR